MGFQAGSRERERKALTYQAAAFIGLVELSIAVKPCLHWGPKGALGIGGPREH